MARYKSRVKAMIPAICAWLLLLTSTTLFFVFPCRYLESEYHFSITLVQAVITLFVIANFFLATFMDPGTITKAGPDEDNDDDLRAPLYKNVEINGITVRMKWCVTCQFYRPPRCSHCSVCNTCIETFDHHCPWVNNCIGRRNYRHFFFFLIFLSLHMLTIFIWCLFFILDHKKSLHETEAVVSIVLIGLITLLIIPVIGLTGFHMVLVSRGRTTNEQVTGKFQGGVNPFSKGCTSNCCYTLCGPIYPKHVKKLKQSKYKHQYDSLYALRKNENAAKLYIDDQVKVINKRFGEKKTRYSYRSKNEDEEKSVKTNLTSKNSISAYRNDGSAIQLERIESTVQSQSRDCEPSPPGSPIPIASSTIASSPPRQNYGGSGASKSYSNLTNDDITTVTHYKSVPEVQKRSPCHVHRQKYPIIMRNTENGKTETTFPAISESNKSGRGNSHPYFTDSSLNMNYSYNMNHPPPNGQEFHHQHYYHHSRPMSPAKSTFISEISQGLYGHHIKHQPGVNLQVSNVDGNGDGGTLIYYSPEAGYLLKKGDSPELELVSDTELQKFRRGRGSIGDEPAFVFSTNTDCQTFNKSEGGPPSKFTKRPMSFVKALEMSDKLGKQGADMNDSQMEEGKDGNMESNNKNNQGGGVGSNQNEDGNTIRQYDLNYEISV